MTSSTVFSSKDFTQRAVADLNAKTHGSALGRTSSFANNFTEELKPACVTGRPFGTNMLVRLLEWLKSDYLLSEIAG
jgi:hypothetical protein